VVVDLSSYFAHTHDRHVFRTRGLAAVAFSTNILDF